MKNVNVDKKLIGRYDTVTSTWRIGYWVGTSFHIVLTYSNGRYAA